MALAGFFQFCSFLDLRDVSIFGDSKVLVDAVCGKSCIRNPQLSGWLERILYLWNKSLGASILHIKRDLNMVADELSKNGLSLDPELWSLQILFEGDLFSIQDFSPLDF